jgi:hypothetical protein
MISRPMGKPWATARNWGAQGVPNIPIYLDFLGADDGIRTRDPHLGKVMMFVLGVRCSPLTSSTISEIVRCVHAVSASSGALC